MRKSLAVSCLFMALSSLTDATIVEKNMPKVGRKQARAVWLDTIATYAKAGKWHELGHLARAAIEDRVTMNELLEVAQMTQVEPFLRAVVATQNMRALPGDAGIAKSELFRIALFIETQINDAIEEIGNSYLSRRKTGLDRSIEVDPEANLVFIHLKDHGVDEIGHGVKKVVTKSILYDVENPELVARCTSNYSMHNEVVALKVMQGSKGIVKLHSYLERNMNDELPVYHMMCKLYEGGALSQAFADGDKFSFQQKLYIVRDLISGIAAMHAKGLIHRDLTARNVLLTDRPSRKEKNNPIEAVIADFGRVKHIDSAHGVKAQFNKRYMSPESIIADQLSGEDYFATDLFALGCILHKLHFEKSGPWIDKANLINPTQPDAVKEAKFIYDLECYREVRLAKHLLNRGFGSDMTTKDRVEQLILQLVHPDPKKRGTAAGCLDEINSIVANYEARRSEPTLPENVQDQP